MSNRQVPQRSLDPQFRRHGQPVEGRVIFPFKSQATVNVVVDDTCPGNYKMGGVINLRELPLQIYGEANSLHPPDEPLQPALSFYGLSDKLADTLYCYDEEARKARIKLQNLKPPKGFKSAKSFTAPIRGTFSADFVNGYHFDILADVFLRKIYVTSSLPAGDTSETGLKALETVAARVKIAKRVLKEVISRYKVVKGGQ